MNVINKSFIIIGTVIGAGFASGKEIYEYFAKFGTNSLLYVIPLFFLFFIVIKIYLSFGKKSKCFVLQDGNNFLSKKVKFCGISLNYLDVFMFLTFFILSSAMYSSIISLFGTYFPSINKTFLHMLVFIFSYIMLNKSYGTLSVISHIVVPIIVICLIINSCFAISEFNINLYDNIGMFSLPILSILYVLQNTFLSSYIIIKTGENTTKKEQNMIAFFVSFILCVLILLGILCFLSNPSINESSMPFATISQSISPIFSIIFGIMIFMSIITTYFATLSSLKEYFRGDKKCNKPIFMLVLIAFFSLLNFGTIIEYFYPIIGCFGAVYLIKITSKLQTN